MGVKDEVSERKRDRGKMREGQTGWKERRNRKKGRTLGEKKEIYKKEKTP